MKNPFVNKYGDKRWWLILISIFIGIKLAAFIVGILIGIFS